MLLANDRCSSRMSGRLLLHVIVSLLIVGLPPGKTLPSSWQAPECTQSCVCFQPAPWFYGDVNVKMRCCKYNRAEPVGFAKNIRSRRGSLFMLDGESCVQTTSTSGNSEEPKTLEQGLLDLLDGRDISFSMPQTSTPSGKPNGFAYKWQKPKRVPGEDDLGKRPPEMVFNSTFSMDTSFPVSMERSSNPVGEEVRDSKSSASISKLSEELENLRAEHRDINEISDQLAAKGQFAGGVQYQLISLKKRKLFLKDRIAFLESKVESLLRESILEESGKNQSVSDPVGAVLSEMMRRLRDLGLKPEQVPPHKDSFFLSLMKGLQRVGLRPNGYDFREGTVMGSERQFPNAAKKARFEVLKLLSSQADKLNPIGGWKLSPEEFQRYFSKAWWTLPAARDDLFMASAHLYTVRIVVFSLEPDRLDEQVYDPPGAIPRATIYLCRRDAHVISTAFLSKSPTDVPISQPTVEGVAKNQVHTPVLEPDAPVKEEIKRGGSRRMSDVSKEDLDAGLGLLDHVLETDDNYQAELDISTSIEAFEDDEVVEDRSNAGRRAGSMYGAPVRTRRIFVAVTLEPEARAAIADVVAGLRRDFPLDSRLLDGVVRWVDPESYHVTLDALDVETGNVGSVVSAVGAAVTASGQSPFVVRTGELGSFWRSAGSGWGRVPRVVWLGLDGAAAGPLLRLREAVDAACSGAAGGSKQGFCAHITLGKTRSRGGEGLAMAERRTLRALGKWVQDPSRPVSLQQLLAGAAPAGAMEGGAGLGRGSKRARSWLRQVDVGTLSGRQKQAVTKQLRKSGRDLGGLNAQLASDFAAPVEADVDVRPKPASVQAGPAGAVAVEILVEAVSVIEAVPVPGTGRVRYTVLERFELGASAMAE